MRNPSQQNRDFDTQSKSLFILKNKNLLKLIVVDYLLIIDIQIHDIMKKYFMYKFPVFIYQNKKTALFAVLLFFTLMGLAIPNISNAGPQDCGVLNAVSCNIGYAIKGLISILGYLVLIAQVAVNQTLKWIIGLTIDRISYTSLDPVRNSAVALGWPIVRDFANILIVLGFIGIALATILRFKEYEAKAILAKLIIAALLVNFSLIICGVAIDASHIVMKNFLDVNQTFMGEFQSSADALNRGVNNNGSAASGGVDVMSFALTVLSMAVVGTLKIAAYGLFAILFFFRMMALWILVILSPLAFVCYVFPATKKVWDMWWSNFSQWVFIGIPGAFFLNLSGQLVVAQLNRPAPLNFTGNGLAGLGNSITNLLGFLVPGAFLIIGFIFSLQISAMGGTMAISTAKKVGGWTGKFAADKTQLTRAKNWAQDKATYWGEKIGVVDQGTLKARQGNRLGEAKKRLDYAKDDHEKLAEIASTPIGAMTSEKVREEKAAAAAMLAKENKFNMIDVSERESIAAHAVAYGASKDAITKNNPELLTGAKDEKTLFQKITKKRSVAERAAEQSLVLEERATLEAGGTSPEEAKRLAAYRTFSDLEIKVAQQKIHENTVRQRALGYSPTSEKEIHNKAIDDRLESEKGGMKNVIRLQNVGATDKQVEILLEEEVARKKKEYQQTYTPSASATMQAKEHVIKEKIAKTVGKLSPSKAAELPKEAISAQVLAILSDSQIEQIGKRGGPNLIGEIKKYKFKLGISTQEYQELIAYYKSLPVGSPERNRIVDIINKINTNSNFK